jgi:uncharacterized protein (TIGR02246 family)
MTTRFIGIAIFMSRMACIASAAQNDAVRESQDRAQIEKVMWQYVRALDTHDADAYAAVFAPDGQFGAGTNAPKGQEALKKMLTDGQQKAAENEAKTGRKTPGTHHIVSNTVIDFVDKDHAKFQAYYMIMIDPAEKGSGPRIAGVGREVDEFVRVKGQWLIQMRDVAPSDDK